MNTHAIAGLWFSSGRAGRLAVAALTLAGFGACSSTKPCNPDTLFVSVTFDAKTSPADKVELDVSLDGAAPKTTTLSHKAGEATGSVEIFFPKGYPVGKRADVTVVAFKGTMALGSKVLTIQKLPTGCGSASVFLGTLPADGGGAAGDVDAAGGGDADAAGTTGAAGGDSDGGGGTGGSTDGGTAGVGAPACTEATTRTCAADGALGACAKGTETCTGGKWSACSIKAATMDVCDVKGDDSNCNGTTNDGCACAATEARLCSEAGAMGNCAKGAQSCVDGKWGPCSILPIAADSCAVKGDDATCNGVANDGCECFVGDPARACSSAGARGNCAAGTQACVNGKWAACTIQPAAVDSCAVKGDDATCNGTPNEGCACLVGDPARACSADGAKGNCAKGTETCTAAGKWSACSIAAAGADVCSVKGDDATCNGIANEGCPCVTGDTQSCGPAAVGICKPGTQTCANGVWGACMNAVNAAARDCTSTADNDCDGKADNTIDLVCTCAAGTSQACGAHPGNDGKGPCKAGTQACVVAADKKTSAFGACSGGIAPAATDTCVSGDDDNCNGALNDGCSCVNNVTKKGCGYCGDGSQTCTDGKTNTYGACAGGTPGQDFTPLTLTNGWGPYGFGTATPAISLDCSGVVHFRGGLVTSGANTSPFTVPAGMRPPVDLYEGVDMYLAAKGRIYIQPSGVASLFPVAATTDATQFTSLEGLSYPLTATGYTALTLNTGWTHAPYSTRNAAIALQGNIVRFQGAISSTGTTLGLFTVPVGFRPPTAVYVEADMFAGAQGRIVVNTDGTVVAQPAGPTSDATGFTSLEGVWYALSATGFTAVTPVNGWVNAPFLTRSVSASVAGGIVRLQGALSTGTAAKLFTLPVGQRPASSVYLPIGLCDSAKGRINVTSAGDVSVLLPTGGAFSTAQCFTSLEGVSFSL